MCSDLWQTLEFFTTKPKFSNPAIVSNSTSLRPLKWKWIYPVVFASSSVWDSGLLSGITLSHHGCHVLKDVCDWFELYRLSFSGPIRPISWHDLCCESSWGNVYKSHKPRPDLIFSSTHTRTDSKAEYRFQLCLSACPVKQWMIYEKSKGADI